MAVRECLPPGKKSPRLEPHSRHIPTLCQCAVARRDRAQPGGLQDGSRASERSGDPLVKGGEGPAPRDGVPEHRRTARERFSGIPPGCGGTLPLDRGSRCASTHGYRLSSLRDDEFLQNRVRSTALAKVVVSRCALRSRHGCSQLGPRGRSQGSPKVEKALTKLLHSFCVFRTIPNGQRA